MMLVKVTKVDSMLMNKLTRCHRKNKNEEVGWSHIKSQEYRFKSAQSTADNKQHILFWEMASSYFHFRR